jgi:hypothetical protein
MGGQHVLAAVRFSIRLRVMRVMPSRRPKRSYSEAVGVVVIGFIWVLRRRAEEGKARDARTAVPGMFLAEWPVAAAVHSAQTAAHGHISLARHALAAEASDRFAAAAAAYRQAGQPIDVARCERLAAGT